MDNTDEKIKSMVIKYVNKKGETKIYKYDTSKYLEKYKEKRQMNNKKKSKQITKYKLKKMIDDLEGNYYNEIYECLLGHLVEKNAVEAFRR